MTRPLHRTSLSRSYLLRTADALATAVATYGIPLLILTTTGSATLTGLAYVVEWVPRLAAFTVGGALVDRHGPRAVFRAANAARTALVAVTAVVLGLLPAGTGATAVALAFSAATGVLGQLSFLSAEAVGAANGLQVGRDAHRVQSVQIGIDQGALIAGPLLGGVLLLAGPVAMLAAVAAFSLIAAAGTAGWRTASVALAGDGSLPLVRSLSTGLRTVAGIPALAWLVAGLAASNLALAVIEASAPITVIQHFGHSSAAVGVVWGTGAAGSLLALAACRRGIDRWELWPVGIAGAAGVSLGSLAIALAPGFAAYAVGVALLLGADAVMTVVLRTLRARLIPASGFGTTLSVTIVAVLVPFPLAGALIAAIPPSGLPALLTVCAVVQGTVLAAAFTGLRRHRAALASQPAPPLRLVPPAVDETHDTAVTRAA
ncbi:MFS transporter [Streptomyces nigrescens]